MSVFIKNFYTVNFGIRGNFMNDSRAHCSVTDIILYGSLLDDIRPMTFPYFKGPVFDLIESRMRKIDPTVEYADTDTFSGASFEEFQYLGAINEIFESQGLYLLPSINREPNEEKGRAKQPK